MVYPGQPVHPVVVYPGQPVHPVVVYPGEPLGHQNILVSVATTVVSPMGDGTTVYAMLLSGAYERRSREGACNYRIRPSAVEIQIIS